MNQKKTSPIRKYLLFLLLILVAIAYLVLRPSAPERVSETRFVLGTLCEIELTAPKTQANLLILDEAFAEIEKWDQILSNYESESQVSMINRMASERPVRIHEEVYDLIGISLGYAKLSDGLFDITIFPLIKLWGFFDQDMRVPELPAIQKARALTGWDYLQLSERGNKHLIYFSKPGVEIDLGGIGKGFIADKVAEYLLSVGMEDFLINMGGNIVANGLSWKGEPWVIGIRDPRKQDDIMNQLQLVNQAVATSGDYERYFVEEGKRFSHIINPKTGFPAEGTIAVTVVAKTGLQADAASSIMYLAPKEQKQAYFDKLNIDHAYVQLEGDSELLYYVK